MLPVNSQSNSADCIISDAIMPRHLGIEAVMEWGRSNRHHIFGTKLSFVIRRTLSPLNQVFGRNKAGAPGVMNVLQVRHVFKVPERVVSLVPVAVIDLHSLSGKAEKGIGDQAVDRPGYSDRPTLQVDVGVPLLMKDGLQERRQRAKSISLNAPDLTEIRDLVPALPSNNRAPFFERLHMLFYRTFDITLTHPDVYTLA